MSFASETKNELARIVPEKKCCMLAEIAGFILFAGSVGLAGGGKFKISMKTKGLATVRHYKTLIKDYFDVDITVSQGKSSSIEKGKVYFMDIGPDNRSEMILREIGILIVREGVNAISDGIYDGMVRTKCCRKAFIRGAFLGSGMINNPEKGYHFEIATSTESKAKDLKRLINTFVDIEAKTIERRKGYGVYIKSREQISDMLAIMGATQQHFNFVDVMLRKDIMAHAHKIENLDTANIDKAVSAAQEQLQWIKKIEREKTLDSLSPKLKEIALMRLEYPEACLEELGKLMDPPLSKSGVNNRLKRIGEIAKSL